MNQHEPGRNVYIGHRYVPLLMGEWDQSIAYEGLSIVTYQGASYTSKKRVPVGIDIDNEEFWVLTGNYDAQIEYYRDDVNRYRDEVTGMGEYVDDEVKDLTNHVNDNVTELNETMNSKVSKGELFLNVKDFGAIGDGVADDTTSFEISINSLKEGETLFIPEGIFKVKPLMIGIDNIKIRCDGYLTQYDNNQEYVINLSKENKDRLNNVKGNLDVRSHDTFENVTSDGIIMTNTYESRLIIHVDGFETNFKMIGDGTGNVYNTIYMIRNFNAKTSVKTLAINRGWTNENRIYGGRYGHFTAIQRVDEILNFDIGETDFYQQDSNHIVNASIEGSGRLVNFRNARGNNIELARLEPPPEQHEWVYPEDYIKFDELSNMNYISTVYDTLYQYGLMTLEGTLNRLSEGEYSITGDHTGYLTKGKHIIFNNNSESYDTYIIGSRYEAEDNLTVFFTSSDFTNIDSVKTLPISDLNGSNVINLYRETYANNRVKQSNEGQLFFGHERIPAINIADANSSDDVSLNVSYLGRQVLSSDFKGNMNLKGSLSSNGILISDRNKIIAQDDIPQSGNHKRGDISLKTYPVDGRSIGWVCTEGGTPGTWEPLNVQAGVLKTVSGRPEFIGQIARTGDGVYIAHDTNSSDDWLMIASKEV